MNVSRLYTLEQYFNISENLHPEATGEFTSLLHNISFAIRIISREVRRAGLNDILGLTNTKNVHGEKVKKLDIFANDTLIRVLSSGGQVCMLASEEEEESIVVKKKHRGKYVMLFDPLDGSSNIDVNITIGTIFSLFKRLDTKTEDEPTIADLLQPGYKQVAAGYILFGSSINMVYTTGHGVQVFTYDPTLGEFLLTNENLIMPKKASLYSLNEGYQLYWHDWTKQYIEYLKSDSEDGTRPYSLRYVGSGVADIHRTLMYGGIFLYPADKKQPKGKIRLLYEANAWAFIVEQAGGRATDGKNRILDIKPTAIHQRTPIILGSEENVLEAEMFIRGEHPYQKNL